jgi:hypothetical protein
MLAKMTDSLFKLRASKRNWSFLAIVLTVVPLYQEDV